MNKIILSIVFIVFLSSIVVAENKFAVEKFVENKDNIKVDSGVKIILRISNPFNQALNIEIKDKNVFGQNGLDIQCLEYTIPNEKEVMLAYEDITPYEEGDFDLGAAQITYTNPETKKEETISSNTLKLSIKKSDKGQSGKRTGITTLYKCGGRSMRSTSFSTGSMQISVNNQNNRQQPTPNPKTMQNRLDQSQQSMNQNSNALKQQMQQRQEEINQQKDALDQKIQNSEEFKQLSEQLKQQNYNPTSQNISPQNNDTGSFSYEFDNGTHKAQISGNMKNNKIQDINRVSETEKNAMKQQIENNEQFKSLDKEMRSQGYKPYDNQLSMNPDHSGSFQYTYKKNDETGTISGDFKKNKIEHIDKQTSEDLKKLQQKLEQHPEMQKMMKTLNSEQFQLNQREFSQIKNNESQFTYSFTHNVTNETARIYGTIDTNGNIQEIKLEKEEENNTEFKSFLYIFILLVLFWIFYKYFFKDRKKTPLSDETKVKTVKIDFRKKTREMIEQAKNLFESGQKKEAFRLIAEAIRFYFKEGFQLKKELNNKDLIAEFDKRKISSEKLKQCLDQCTLVEFAKFTPRKKEFELLVIMVQKELLKL